MRSYVVDNTCISGTPATIVNVGSKQGITTPPGNTAYNVSKAGVKIATEGLQHELNGGHEKSGWYIAFVVVD